MSKNKDKETLPPIIEDDEEKVLEPEIIMGDAISDDEDGDDELPDDEEIDPFRDRFEE